ncbi:MAG TPA: S1 RNA-binding domain-containing protein, partial [Isosphaeraceae bacterium]|nr:S1 RNA-binding domain-containing protein [Isosphaeraceae bacterium]
MSEQRPEESAGAPPEGPPHSPLPTAASPPPGSRPQPAPEPAPPQDVPLKRQWDAELDAELEKALAGFDEKSYETVAPKSGQTGMPEQGDMRGQEASAGAQKGKVVAVRGDTVFIDMGTKSEGVVPLEQFQGEPPKPGQVIEVMVDRFDPEEGLLLLSLKGAAVEANWENLRKGLIVEAHATKSNKGGLEVVVDGIRGFLPVSQIDINRVDDAAVWVGQKFRAIVTEADQRQRNLVISRRELLEREREELREKTWSALAEGQVRAGVIRSVKSFGAFVDLGGVDGLLHVADLSWARVADAGQLVKVGQEVQVKVLKIDRQTSKINLGLKQLQPSPWDGIDQKYARGATVPGKVTRLMDFGAFVELEPGVEGLIHVSELSPNRVRRAADIVQPGQQVEVRILKVDGEAKKISL